MRWASSQGPSLVPKSRNDRTRPNPPRSPQLLSRLHRSLSCHLSFLLHFLLRVAWGLGSCLAAVGAGKDPPSALDPAMASNGPSSMATTPAASVVVSKARGGLGCGGSTLRSTPRDGLILEGSRDLAGLTAQAMP